MALKIELQLYCSMYCACEDGIRLMRDADCSGDDGDEIATPAVLSI
jgi:hypothetical protein